MEAENAIFEIVLSLGGYWLIDPKTLKRRPSQRMAPLLPGYYIVSWPNYASLRRFDQYALYHGPFKNRKEAVDAVTVLCQSRKCIQTMPGAESIGNKGASKAKMNQAGW